ncbi:MAG TPA: lysylphosphatidylglycerol synthase transmembrane domain-containing protein [Gemmataceae bacterium]|nr:lysylphosphatidylglycerol synthase transmembrane domain-containing protein [Gemmataceae bacterium]
MIRLAAGLALLAWLAWQTDWGPAAEAVRRLRWEVGLAALALYGLTQVLSSWRWQMLARPLGFNPPLRHLVGFYFIGMFFNLVLPTSVGGDVVRAWYLDGGSGRRSAALLSVLLDRASGLMLLLLLACGAVLVSPLDLPLWLVGAVWSMAAAMVLGLAALPLLARYRLLSARHEELGARLQRCLPLLLRPGPLLLSGLVQAANVVLVWMIGRALGLAVADSYYWVLVPVVTLLTLLPISLNGMGIREGGTVLLLGLQGVPAGPALTLALLWFAVFTVAGLAGAPVYLFGSFPRFQVQADDQPLGDRSDQGRAGQPRAAA